MSHKKPPHINICEFCKKEFLSKQHHTLIQKFCSYKCVGQSKVGIKRTVKKVKNSTQFKVGHKPTNGFDKRPPIGDKHGNWKGGEETFIQRKKVCDLKRRSCGEVKLETIQMVYEDNIKKYGTLTCYLCENPIQFKKDNLEHKIPLIRGGNNLYENLAVSCKSCNCKKATKTEEEYRKELQNV